MSKYGFPLICALMALLITGCFPKDDNKVKNTAVAQDTGSGGSSTPTPANSGNEDEDEEEEDPNEGEILVQPTVLPKKSDCITIPDESDPDYASDSSVLAAERRDVGWIKSYVTNETEADTNEACFLNPTSVGRGLNEYVIGVKKGQKFSLFFTDGLKTIWAGVAAKVISEKLIESNALLTPEYIKANRGNIQWFFENRTAGVTTISGLTPGLNTNTLKLTAKLEKGTAVRMEVLYRWYLDIQITPEGSNTTAENPLYLYIYEMTD